MRRKSKLYNYEKPTVVVDWKLTVEDPAAARRAVANKWLTETPYTRYRYNVEQCADGSRVYLLRPTWLNKGFDFMVNVEGFRSRTRAARGATREMPSHRDVIQDLLEKIQGDPEATEPWFDAVCAIYDCAEPDVVLPQHRRAAEGTVGLPADQLLYIMKWLFIEQDVTYWAQTGRDMLMAAIESEVFPSCLED